MLIEPASTKEKNYNTSEIVEHIARAVLATGLAPYSGDFDAWRTQLLEVIPEISRRIPPDMRRYLPVRDDVLKLVVKCAYGIAPFSREYVLKHYQKQHRDKSYLVYPAADTRRVCILFSGYIDRVTYNRYSWYFDESEKWEGDTMYLFLNDPGLHWYVGKEGGDDVKTYSEIIETILDQRGLAPARAFTIGASMGGYGAIYYALKLGLGGCIAVHPQLTYKGTRRYELGNWERQIRECGSNFYDVDDLISKARTVPPLYLECGNHPADIYGVDRVVETLSQRNATYILHRPPTREHITASPSRERIEAVLNFFQSFQQT